MDTTGLRVQRLHPAAGTAHEQRAVLHGGRRERGHVTGKTKRPLELQASDVADSQARALRRLEARVVL